MIRICNIQGNQLLSVSITQSCQKVEELMAADYIQLSWNSDLSDELPLGAYIEYNGERYSLLEPYKPTQKDESEYTYTPKFESRVRAWGKKPFFFYSGASKEPDWTLTSNPADFMRCVCDAIREETGESWTYSIDASLPASASLSFSSSDILSGLNQIAGAFETEWFADKETNTLYLGLLSHGSEVTLEVGKNISVPSVQNSREGYYTRFYAFGSTRNITQDYTGSNTNNLVNKRLTLDPNKYPQGYKDVRGGLSEGEIFSKVLIFDDVYPSAKLGISGVRNRLMYRLDESGNKVQLGTDDSGNPIYDQYTIWYFRIEGFTFSQSNVIDGLTPSISFQSGALNGREFEIIYYNEDKKITTSDGIVFEAKQGDYEIKFIEENNLIIPTMTGLVPSDGDEVVLFNIKMPSEYTQSAYAELEEELDKAIARMTSDLSNYSFKSNPVAFNESNPNLSIGRKVRYVNGGYSYSTRVIKLTTQLDFPIEQSITIGNEKVKGNTQQLKEEVASANKDLNLMAVFNEMTQTIQQSYNRTQQMMLDGFAAIKNIWQLRETESGEKYIFSAFDVVTQKGVTSFADGKMLDLPSIYDGLPIDNQTLIWEEVDGVKVLKAKASGSGEGTIKDVVVNGSGNAITDVTLSTDKTGLVFTKGLEFAEKKYVDVTFVTLSTAQTITGQKNFTGGFLVSGEELKYNSTNTEWLFQKNVRLRNGNSNYGMSLFFGDGSYCYLNEDTDDHLTAYASSGISLKTSTSSWVDITSKGLKVNGGQITYNASEGYFQLDGDLLVTGGITAFADRYSSTSIMDAIVCDEQTITVEEVNGVKTLKVIGGGSGGGVDEEAVKDIIDSYLTDDKLPTATTLQKGIASFDSNSFNVSSGHVTFNGGKVKVVTSTPSSYESNTLYVIVG